MHIDGERNATEAHQRKPELLLLHGRASDAVIQKRHRRETASLVADTLEIRYEYTAFRTIRPVRNVAPLRGAPPIFDQSKERLGAMIEVHE